MERRLLSWVIASTAFLFIYIALNGMFGPPRNQNLPGNGDADVVADADADALPDADLAVPDADPDAEDAIEEPPRPEKASYQTLGSFDPNSGFLMLVYLNSRGAGIERVELTERKENGRLKYRRVDVLGGYAGYMGLTNLDDRDGARVNVIGPGTPVALARSLQDGIADGLQAGDIITAVNEVSVADRLAYEAVLTEIEPGKPATLTVLRDEQPLKYEVTLTEHPLDLIRMSSRGGADEIEGNLDRLSCLMTLAGVGNRELKESDREMPSLPTQHREIWDVVEQPSADIGPQTAAYRLPVSRRALDRMEAAPVDLLHSYTLQPGSYIIDMEVGVENQGEEAQELAYRLEGPNGITLEGWWYSNKISPNFGGAGARDVIYRTAADGHVLWGTYPLIKEARDKTSGPAKVLFAPQDSEASRSLNYIGVDAQYFTVAYLPEGEASFDQYKRAGATLVADVSDLPKHKERAANTSFFLDSQSVSVAPGESLKHRVRMFAGPKQEELLATYGLSDAIYYGWFSMIARPLQQLLHLLKMIVQNYAVAIVLLTLMVRLLMFPLGRRAAVHAQKMQELAPELKKIGEKYKDDIEARLKAQRELQQRAGFNPLSGCLPMFIQLPIFIGLYRCLSVDIELRQAALSPALQWCSNLAAPDMLAYWGDWMWEYFAGRGTGWLGPYFNILPMIVMVLFLLQQKMFMPPATDEQTAMTQKVMTFMTLFMGFLFFRVPSGLCIYFITSSLWGIAERKLVKKSLPPKGEGSLALAGAGDSVAAGPQGAGGSGSKSFADRVRERIANEPPPAPRPAQRKRPNLKKKR
ncbi:YidC/Oxa1 family insertase periplasmic-domain containing protein [Roseimaritima sediminicola]|uniref:YidC/Oxa1 family insertase periplasmic-domain containing protein n=1 Tax=Roseimaritima sediminicola TaxID=2662066 RepID=UPI0012984F89|nr:YidC/Oxa1 family insertase periplasmic-domain containing protein [Roseimaritima sediminicola]